MEVANYPPLYKLRRGVLKQVKNSLRVQIVSFLIRHCYLTTKDKINTPYSIFMQVF